MIGNSMVVKTLKKFYVASENMIGRKIFHDVVSESISTQIKQKHAIMIFRNLDESTGYQTFDCKRVDQQCRQHDRW